MKRHLPKIKGNDASYISITQNNILFQILPYIVGSLWDDHRFFVLHWTLWIWWDCVETGFQMPHIDINDIFYSAQRTSIHYFIIQYNISWFLLSNFY